MGVLQYGAKEELPKGQVLLFIYQMKRNGTEMESELSTLTEFNRFVSMLSID